MSARRTKRIDGRYNVALTADNSDGTRRRLYFDGRTQAEARRKADAARERVAQGGPVRDATRSVSDWFAEWRGTFLQASDRASSTKSLYAGLTLRHVEPVIGRTPLGQVRPSDVTRVLLTMERGGSAASTRRNAYAALRSEPPWVGVRRWRCGGATSISAEPRRASRARWCAATGGSSSPTPSRSAPDVPSR
jgi:integrase